MFVKSFKSGLLLQQSPVSRRLIENRIINIILYAMKTSKSIVMGLLLLMVCGAAKATDAPAKKLSRPYVINSYVDAMIRGRLNGLNKILAPSAEFSMMRGKQLLSFDKTQMLDYMQSNKNVDMACTTSTSVIESNPDITMVKVDMKFDGFVRSNYITLTDTADGWKITNVYSVFKQM
jgi:hypothetical protein